MKINEYTTNTFYANIYIGSIRGYNGSPFTLNQIIAAIARFQENMEGKRNIGIADIVSVRITSTTYQIKGYMENGWEISAINYPRYPKDKDSIMVYMIEMAKFLLVTFEQNRITVVNPERSITFESENAESDPRSPGQS